MESQLTVGIVLFDGIEVLDFARPFEVFAAAGSDGASSVPFNVFTVAERGQLTAQTWSMIGRGGAAASRSVDRIPTRKRDEKRRLSVRISALWPHP